MIQPWCSIDAEGSALLRLHVQPGARKTEIVGLHGEALKLRLAAAPVEGRANAALIEYLAMLLDVPRASVELVAGASGRRKLVRISGATAAALDALRTHRGNVSRP